MYDELIKNLRICSRCDFGQDCNGCTQNSDDVFCCDKLLHQAADAIEELTAVCKKQEIDLVELTGEVASKPQWIPVTERLPEPMKDVVLFMRYGEYKQLSEIAVGYYDDKLSHFSYCDVTHWMPIPEPPKDG